MAKQLPRRVFRLSNKEVRVLQTIMDNIGGNPDSTARGVTDILNSRLRKTFGERAPVETEGNIWFLENV